jgi:hypothetical protein
MASSTESASFTDHLERGLGKYGAVFAVADIRVAGNTPKFLHSRHNSPTHHFATTISRQQHHIF